MKKLKRTEYLINEEFNNKLICDVKCSIEGDFIVIDCQSFKIEFETFTDSLVSYFNVSPCECCGLGLMEMDFINEVIENMDEIRDILNNDEDYEDFDF